MAAPTRGLWVDSRHVRHADLVSVRDAGRVARLRYARLFAVTAARSTGDRPLVGRDDELDRAVEVLGSSNASGLVLAGAGGVGKTRLARAAVDVARCDDDVVVSLIATRSTASVPLGAFAPIVGDPGERPERLLARARAAVREHADGHRMLLLVDDAHLLDDVSAALLLTLAEGPDVRPVVTVRTGEPVPDAVTALWKDAGLERLDLEPLPDHAADELAEAVAGGPIDAPSHVVIRRAGRGNPLAITELVRGATLAGRLVDEDGVLRLGDDLPVSGRITELIDDRLADLSDDELTTLALVALGEPIDHASVRRTGRSRRLPALERRGLIVVSDDGADLTVRLGHPLHGEVVLERVGELTRRELLGELIDDLGPRVREPDDELRLATWSLAARRPVDPELLIRAARRSWARTDHRGTAEFAAAAWETAPSADSGHLLGHALGRTGRSEDAERILAAAWELATDDRERLLVGQTRCDNLFRGLGDADRALACSRQVESSITDPDMRLEMVAGRSTLEVQAGRIPDGLELARPILEAGRPDRAFVTASYSAGLALALAGRTEEAMDVAARALPIHQQVWRDDLFSTEPGVHHIVTVVALAEAGRLVEADQLTEVGVQLAGSAGRGYGFGFFAMLRGMVLVRRGLPRQGARWCREAVTALRSAGYAGTGRWALAGIAHASALLRDRETAEAALAEAEELHAHTPIRLNESVVDDARGWVRLVFGEPEEAREVFRAAAERDASDGAVAGAGQLAHSLARAGDPGAAARLLDELAARSDGELVVTRRDHAHALADDDAAGLEEVSGRFTAIGADLDAAEAIAAAAWAHERAGDQRQAVAAARRAAALLADCEDAVTPTMRGLGRIDVEPLSAREREVALLAADGFSSREVAERLHVSVRTVDNHLQRVYRKLGVTGRSGLADALGDPLGPA